MARSSLDALRAAIPKALRLSSNRGLRDVLQEVGGALSRYRLRTALSVLGIVLGIAAVIAMASVADGARLDTLRRIEALGLDNILVRSRSASGWWGRAGPNDLSVGDAVRLRALLPMSRTVTPLIERFEQVSGPERSRGASVLGVASEYGSVLDLRMLRGRFISPSDDTSGVAVCVLGSQVARALFAYADPVDQSVRFGRSWYTVVGVLGDRNTDPRPVGSRPARDLNQAVFVPIGVLLGHPVDADPAQRVDEIWIRVAEGRLVDEIGRIAEHTLQGPGHAGAEFEFVVPRALLAERARIQRTFTIVIVAIAVITLVVGGVGIMNIMLASVLERTAEIGLRRTVGASRRDIVVQFLAESVVLTAAGGLIGILVGVAESWVIARWAEWPTHVSAWAVLAAVLVSCAVGLLFGSYPAARAASLQPIDALRYE